jgi:hydrogenase expression/formation protein HypC
MEIVELGEGGRGVAAADGVSVAVDLSLVASPSLGDYVIVHAGFAIEKLDREEADARIALFREIGKLRP